MVVADTLLWVPARKLDAFMALLDSRISAPPSSGFGEFIRMMSLHTLCYYVPVRMLIRGIYDTNTERDHNPLYQMIGRPVCGPAGACLAPRLTEAARSVHNNAHIYAPMLGNSSYVDKDET